MKNFALFIVCLIGCESLSGMKNDKPNWHEMYHSGTNGLKIRLKNVPDQNNTLSLSNMNLTCLDECDMLKPLFEQAILEVSSEELTVPSNDISIDFDESSISFANVAIRALSLAHNPQLTTLPECLFKFEELEKLIISFSGIVTFQPVFLDIPKLKHLVLSRYQFNELSEDGRFKDFAMKLDFVTIEHIRNEPPFTDKAVEIARLLTNKKLLDK